MTLLVAIGTVPDWHRDAACGDLGKLFASKKPDDVDKQRKVCAACPVRVRCAADAAAKRKNQLPDLVVAGQTRAEHLNGRLVNARRACTRCGEWKPLPEFNPKKRGKHGRASICKRCENARQRAAYQAKKTATS
ncbi:WhiB family transcriptional regulator [Nonomuraea sp. M3C6]|uniref:WhiB family transcriptional regulator n=1 Tax=Nonomuraea marmarensis TaxID=3351344 RepID=A0ABW7AP63_9ACTN